MSPIKDWPLTISTQLFFVSDGAIIRFPLAAVHIVTRAALDETASWSTRSYRLTAVQKKLSLIKSVARFGWTDGAEWESASTKQPMTPSSLFCLSFSLWHQRLLPCNPIATCNAVAVPGNGLIRAYIPNSTGARPFLLPTYLLGFFSLSYSYCYSTRMSIGQKEVSPKEIKPIERTWEKRIRWISSLGLSNWESYRNESFQNLRNFSEWKLGI